MTHGMVCAPQPEAVEAGAMALKRGGNAVDAAVACALVQTVVDPFMCGIAGFGSMHLYLPERGAHSCLDFHGRAPEKAREDMWADLIEAETEDGFGFLLKGRVNDIGYGAITTPMTLKALDDALRRYGSMELAALIEPAAEYAEQGWTVRPHVAYFWNLAEQAGRVEHWKRLDYSAAGAAVYLNRDGSRKKVGDTGVNPDMARTLKRIAEDGVGVFYEGDIARAIAADMEVGGGLMTLADLEAVAADENEPLWGEYRGHRIASNPPPGGGVMVLEMLNILENFDLAGMGHNSPRYIATVSEAMKIATVDKDAHVGDPRFVDVPLERLLSKDYARAKAEAIRAGDIAHVERFGADEPKDTTHVCAIDEAGNCVSLTHSLGMPSGVVTDGLGFMYSGCMCVFDPRPGRTGSIHPGKSRFSSIAPTIVFRGDEPYLVIGAPGGTYIAMGVLQGILNVVDFGMDAAAAVAAPRFCTTSDVIDVTNRIPRFVTAELEAMGYTVRRSPMSYHFAGVHAIVNEGGRWHGGADPGRDGMALEV